MKIWILQGQLSLLRCQVGVSQSVISARGPTNEQKYIAHRIVLKADPEDLTRQSLPSPILPASAIHVATCFWAWLYVIDDLTEEGDCFNCIEAYIEILSTVTSLSGSSAKIDGIRLSRDLAENSKLEDCKIVLSAFHNVVSTACLQTNENASQITIIEAWKVDFWLEVLAVVKALQTEKSLQGRDFSMRESLKLRCVTISARPFFVLLKASLALPPILDMVTSPDANPGASCYGSAK